MTVGNSGKKPSWLPYKDTRKYTCYGFLEGLTGDQISYAGQASRKVEISCFDGSSIVGDVLRINNSHVDDKLYVGFEAAIDLTNVHVKAEFSLNFSYFGRLRDSIKHLRPEVIRRIIPSASKFNDNSEDRCTDFDQCKDILRLDDCSKDQVNALRTVISGEPNSPPILISGPFGSGKTRVLALSSRYYLYCNDESVKILVCTQQHVSADAFFEIFDDISPKKDKGVEIVRLIPDYYFRNSNIECYQTLDNVNPSIFKQKKKVLIITTCSKVLPVGFFTHIFLDEGAQMREPEAVAPLNFAKEDTKIVIAGDYRQVAIE